MYFREDQRFRQPYLWIIGIFFSSLISGSALFFTAQQVIRNNQADAEPHSLVLLIAICAAIVLTNIGLLILFAVMVLQVEVNQNGLFVRFVPFHRKVRQIDLRTVASVDAVRYRAFMEYGGYGIRRRRDAKAYNVGGNEGVRINYENGYHLLIGTQYPAALRDAVVKALDTVTTTAS